MTMPKKKSGSKNVNFGFWGSEPQTLNLSYRWYGGICRGCGERSCGERIFRLSLSVPEIFDLKFLHFDLICIQTGSGRGKMTSSPGSGRRGLQSLARASYCGFAFRRYSTLNFLPISPNEKMSTDVIIIDNKKTLETESIINSSTLGVIGVVLSTPS